MRRRSTSAPPLDAALTDILLHATIRQPMVDACTALRVAVSSLGGNPARAADRATTLPDEVRALAVEVERLAAAVGGDTDA